MKKEDLEIVEYKPGMFAVNDNYYGDSHESFISRKGAELAIEEILKFEEKMKELRKVK